MIDRKFKWKVKSLKLENWLIEDNKKLLIANLERIRNYHCENILREKILLDAIKETIDRVDELILKQED